ncbi:bifunctional serine/threonine-protein kinase/formylglycine-generating enzyme family protein [Marinibactrum halimedae]|uniref:Protein kinase domain-containing protein n=1 Tax=Marinibactrum halimedae TaxID=1444977 RepID=A0AA37T3J2_9GAMM|nr:bifunctional serine/threonine-protein kinase/formylglycine-generating enzyme family protein [Marinibactrum halimedae]MCD9458351.1 protein kinase [Marinibactrum halimedae]GLS26048.1 hypothetical protein GCM10007877_17630 [Marinibactrum halimedae]
MSEEDRTVFVSQPSNKEGSPDDNGDKTVFTPRKPVVKKPTDNKHSITGDNRKSAQAASPKQTQVSDRTVIADRPRQATPAQASPNDRTLIAKPSGAQSQGAQGAPAQDSGAHTKHRNYERKPIAPTAPQSSSPQTGEDLRVIRNRFEIVDLLGVGGMGAVYQAIDRRKVEARDSNPYVAVKVLNEDFRRHPQAFVTLQREARKSQTLAHPNIVNVHDFDRDGEIVFMTMEFLDGQPLDTLLRGSNGLGLEHQLALRVTKDIASALSYAHSHGIVHSDFKPGNIFVTASEEDKEASNIAAKVLDFGIARAVSEGVDEDDEFDAGSLGALTPAYASYEMLEGEDPDPRDDVYALACVAYEMLTGRHPYDKTPANKVTTDKPSRITALSNRQWRALEKALALHREDRTASVDEFVSEFFGTRRSPVIVFGLLAVMAVVAIVSYFQVQQREEALRQELEKERVVELRQQTYTFSVERMEELLTENLLSKKWQSNARKTLEELSGVAEEDDTVVADFEMRISDQFVQLAADAREAGDLDAARARLEIAKKWVEITEPIVLEKAAIEQAQRDLEASIAAAEAAEEAREQAAIRAEKARQNRIQAQKEKDAYDRAVKQLFSKFACKKNLNLAGEPKAAFDAFSQKYPQQAMTFVPQLSGMTETCVKQTARRSPSSAQDMLNVARQLFPSQASLKSLKIDFCGHIRAGSAKPCRDSARKGFKPPVMVVYPSPDDPDIKLAISRYEISVRDANKYCAATKACSSIGGDDKLPVTSFSFAEANQYATWLGQMTGYEYRIPTKSEWQGGARAAGSQPDPNRNCYLKFNGISKGDSVIPVNSGERNGYGLVNSLGNVQEWVTSGSSVLAMGGSIRDPMSRCDAETVHEHNGSPDGITGFRVLRVVQ